MTDSQPIGQFEIGAEIVNDVHLTFDAAPDLRLPTESWGAIRIDVQELEAENQQAMLAFQLFRRCAQRRDSVDTEHAVQYDRESILTAIRRRVRRQPQSRLPDGITAVRIPHDRIDAAITAIGKADPDRLSQQAGNQLAEAVVTFEEARNRNAPSSELAYLNEHLGEIAPEWLHRAYLSASELRALSTLLNQADDRVAYLDTSNSR